MYIPQPVKAKLNEGIVESGGGLRKMTVVFMELLDVDIEVTEDSDALDQVHVPRIRRIPSCRVSESLVVSVTRMSIRREERVTLGEFERWPCFYLLVDPRRYQRHGEQPTLPTSTPQKASTE